MSENRYIKGLFKDTAHIDQPANTWRYAKNMVIDEKMGSISNEGGTDPAGQLTVAGAPNRPFKAIGIVEVSYDRAVMFLTECSPLPGTVPISEIGIWEKNIYRRIFRPDIVNFPTHDLEFNCNYPIEGTFKVDAKGDLLVYWTDDFNPPRVLNIDRQERNPTVQMRKLYGLTSPDLKDINILNLFPFGGSVPHIWVGDNATWASPHQTAVKEGGGLRTGVYYLALAYVDADFVATNFLTVSNPIPIVDEFDWTRPTTKKDGFKAGGQTTKSLCWRVSNLNTDYKYVRPVVIRKMGDATDAYKLNDVEINMNLAPGPHQEISFSGIEGFSTGSVEEVIIDTVAYDTAKTIQQLDNILYVGNTTGTKDVGYQKYANNIKLTSVVRAIDEFDVYWATVDNFETGFGGHPVDKRQIVDHTKSYRYIPNIFSWKGYTRDETYAFYIAFILKDGSMSYAYHIPGRESSASTIENTSPYPLGLLYRHLRDVSPSASRLFHWKDYSEVPGNRNMNYWENNTEIYPLSENYEIWDGAGEILPSLKGTNVRHHHFPSNWNNSRKSIEKANCTTTEDSDGLQTNTIALDGFFRMEHKGSPETEFPAAPFRRASFRHGPYATSGNGALCASTCWSCGANDAPYTGSSTNKGPDCWFTANQEMDVGVSYHMWLFRYATGGAAQPSVCRIATNATNNGGVTTGGSNTIADYGGCGAGQHVDYNAGSMSSIHLMPGEKIWIECTSQTSGGGGAKAREADSNDANGCDSSCDGPANNCKSSVQFTVLSTTAAADPDWYSDAKICHDIKILGFELDDIKVPKSIADKAQGFRIYRAKRDHSNRTVLGQAPLLPMSQHFSQIGVCEEAGQDADVKEILQTLQDNPEFFWSVDPWPLNSAETIPYYSYQDNLDAWGSEEASKVFSFHDFYLLHSKNSLAPATHVKLIYAIQNLAWNGSATDQDKMAITEIAMSTEGVKSIETGWGWDAEQNCYPQEINSAIFIGNIYDNRLDGNFYVPRLIGQKAKTYLMGDSIFDGTDLGFGGKIFNEFGTSAIILSLKDTHEIPTRFTLNSPDGTLDFAGISYTSGSDWDDYGNNLLGHGSLLTNPIGTLAPDGEPSHPWRSNYWMANLGAFKTDLYKSIDSNELVWTGFEVLGDDFENYVFDDNTGASTYGGADWKTRTTHPDGIFGGDTFITRYGYSVAVKPSNADEASYPRRALHHHIVESTDNINFRHVESADSFYFPNTPAKTVLKYAGNKDFNHQDNLKYNDNYSADNNIRVAFPLPLRDVNQDDFPTRTHRSAKHDTTSLIDNYRIFLANQYKDLPKNRGDLWKLSSFNNLLYFHMEDSLFAAKGKQSMSMSDGSEAYVGSGDIFTQDPDELVQTDGGYGGTQSQFAAITTKHGYFFVDVSSKKIFLMTDKLTDISSAGMQNWFRDNIPPALEEFGYLGCVADNPNAGFGYHSIYDPIYKRVVLTKRDVEPTAAFLVGYNLGPTALGKIRFFQSTCDYKKLTPGKWGNVWEPLSFGDSTYFHRGGWTVSYYPETKVWGSFHDYLPYIYFNTSRNFYGLSDNVNPFAPNPQVIYSHNSTTLYGQFYELEPPDGGTIVYPFEFEVIHNEFKADTVLFSAFDYTLETFNQDSISVLEHGFTSYFLYTTLQHSGENALEYLVSTRRIGNEWKVNKFRDMAVIAANTSPYYMSPNINVTGQTNTGTVTSSFINNMFIYDGMNKTVNPLYLDLAKTWDLQKKFIDKWLGIRLIYDNITNNLLNLYSTNVAVRKMHR